MLNLIRSIDIRKVAVGLSIFAAVAHGIISGEFALDHLVPASWDDAIKAWCGVYLFIFPLLIGAHSYTAAPWAKADDNNLATRGGPKISSVAVILLTVGMTTLLAIAFVASAQAADLSTKAPKFISPFVPNSAGGWYVGIGTSAGLANGSNSGSNLFAPSLIGGNLVADGASVDVDGGYIKNGGPLGTWWRLQAGVSYQNISGGTPAGSINSRWRVFQEGDIGANILADVFSKIGSLGNLSSTFTALNSFVPALPANVSTVGTPQQYVGVVLEETDLSGTFGAASGQTWMLDYGVKTGWIWELPGADGKTPNGNALEVFAQVTWPNQGLTLNNVFAAGGQPLTIGPAIKLGPMYRAGVTYQFGL